MKKTFITFLTIGTLGTSLFFQGCSKKKDDPAPATTSTTGTTTSSTTSGTTTTSTTSGSTSGTTTSGSTTSGSTSSSTTTSGSTTSSTTTSGSTTSSTTTSGTTTSGSTTTGTTMPGAVAKNTWSVKGKLYTGAAAIGFVGNIFAAKSADNTNFQFKFKTKPTVNGTYNIVSMIDGPKNDTDVAIAFFTDVLNYWSLSSTTGKVTVTVTGTVIKAVVTDVTLYNPYNESELSGVSGNLESNF